MDHFPSLAAKRKATKIAQASVSKCDTEEQVVQHLLDTKPAILCCGKELWLDKANIEDDIQGFVERFTRKGLADRSDRFQYLQATLKEKWNDEPDKFLSLMGFLFAMEDNSTSVEYRMEVGCKEYSKLPDIQLESISVLKKREQDEILKQELVEELAKERVITQYSSDSDLSDWESDDDEPEKEDQPAFTKLGDEDTEILNDKSALSSTIGSDLFRKSKQVTWTPSSQEALGFLKQNVRQITISSLSQPVISSQIDLHFKFGQYWEWKKWNKIGTNPNMQLLREGDIIRELLWNFSRPCTLNSTMFNNDWNLKQKHMVSSLGRKTLSVFLQSYGQAISVLQSLKLFARHVLQPESSKSKFSKIVQAFAHGISCIIRDISEHLGSLQIPSAEQGDRASTLTLLQLQSQMRRYFSTLRYLENIFLQCFGDKRNIIQDEDKLNSWQVSVTLISVLETALTVEREPEMWRLVLFLFGNCLLAFFDDFLRPLQTTEWSRTCIFKRNRRASLSDSNFWSVAVAVHPYQEELQKQQILPLSCLNTTIPKMATFLKTVEMLRQLEDNPGSITGELPHPRAIIQEFLQTILPSVFSGSTNSHASYEIPPNELQKYFNFLNLSDRRVLGSFSSVLRKSGSGNSYGGHNDYEYLKLEEYFKIQEVPYIGSMEILPTVLDNFLDPIFEKGHKSLRKIFTDFKIHESIALFQQIILGAREDFSQAVLQLTQTLNTSSRFTYQDDARKDPDFQKLLHECYPEGRENFDINFRLDSTSDLKCQFLVKAKFPLNVLLTPEGIKKYLFISQQLLRVRKSVWSLINLRMKDCRPAEGLSHHRVYLFRFSLLHFCSTLAAFFMLKIFANDFSSAPEGYANFTEILGAHELYLQRIELKLLKIKFMDSLIIKKMVSMSEALEKTWEKGISLSLMIKLEECLKQCWFAVNDFCKATTNTEYNELHYHLGSTPGYL